MRVLDDIDEVAVQLAVRGERAGRLNAGERIEVVRILTRRHLSARQIADHAGCSTRTVVRERAHLGISQPHPNQTIQQKEAA